MRGRERRELVLQRESRRRAIATLLRERSHEDALELHRVRRVDDARTRGSSSMICLFSRYSFAA